MRANERTPSELIEHVGHIINDRTNKSLPTFYTISIEQFGKVTPVAEKEAGPDNFKNDVFRYLSDYDLTALVVELYSGKSRNVKKPFQTFRIELKKQNPTIISLGNDNETVQEAKPLDSSIPVSRYYDEKFELQMRIMRTEMEKQTLAERLNQLNDKYDERLKDQERLYLEKMRLLEQDLKEAQDELIDFEKEIARYEREKHNSFGNLALGSIASRMLEGFVKSDAGSGLLKGLLGKDGYSTMQNHLAGIDNNEPEKLPEQETARLITQPEAQSKDARSVALRLIQDAGKSLPDNYLRMLYDIAELGTKNLQALHILWSYAQQLKQQDITQPAAKDEEENTNDTDDEPPI